MKELDQVLESAEASLFVSMSELKKRNVFVGEKRTSVTLEPQVWQILHDIAEELNTDVHKLSTFINERKSEESSLSSAIRVFLISYLNIKLKKARA